MLPDYERLKSDYEGFEEMIAVAKSEGSAGGGKVTLGEGIQLVAAIGFRAFDIAKKASHDEPRDVVVSWCKDIAKKLYHDKDIGIDVDIPVIFEPAETWFENTIIDTIIDTVANQLFDREV